MSHSALYARVQKALGDFIKGDSQPPWERAPIIIYGAGNFGRDLAQVLLRRGVKVLGFLDRNGAGQVVVADLCSYSLGSDQAKKWPAENPVVIIGMQNSFFPLRLVDADLRRAGFSHVITPMEVYSRLEKSEMAWRFWLGTQKEYLHASEDIERTRALWADPESERIFLETLLFRLGFDLEAASTISDVKCQYADPTVPRWREPLRLVDGGAYNGDTLQTLRHHNYGFESVYAFEPDLKNFQDLRNTVRTLDLKSQISLWPCGVGASTCHVRFSGGSGTASQISSSGDSVIPVVALDDVLHGPPINLLKLDIEGFEEEALQGARGLIEKFRPGLAVCLYHHPHHLWSIPLWINQLNLGYRFHCRTYLHNTFETVLYAQTD